MIFTFGVNRKVLPYSLAFFSHSPICPTFMAKFPIFKVVLCLHSGSDGAIAAQASPAELYDMFGSPLESLCVHSPRLAACAVIPADAGIQKPDWMPDQVRHDAEYPAACGGVVYNEDDLYERHWGTWETF